MSRHDRNRRLPPLELPPDEHLSQAAQARDANPVKCDRARNAVLAVHPRLSVVQKAMRHAHLPNPDRCITATQLAMAAGY